MSNIKDFFTKPAAEAGCKLPVKAPDGSDTGDWVEIVGTESDQFRQAKIVAEREAFAETVRFKASERGGENPCKHDSDGVLRDINTRLIASTIVSWSFDDDCTDDNKIALLDNAEYIRDLVNTSAADNGTFFKKKPMS